MAERKGELEKAFVYIVPLKRVYWGRRTNRARRAVNIVRNFVKRHLKVQEVVIANELNNYIWSRSREKPPRRVKILVKVYKVKGEGEEEEEKEKLVAVARLAPPDAKPGPVEVKEKKG